MANRGFRMLAIVAWAAAIVVILSAGWVLLSGRARMPASPAVPPPMGFAVEPFVLVDQAGRPFTQEDLAGHVWIADFIFTRCPGPCPLMTQKMRLLQDQIDDPAVRFLSISIDPEYDRPEVLSEYAKEHGADVRRWVFATGQPATIRKLGADMRLGAIPGEGQDLMLHSTRFILLDGQGRIRGHYDSTDEQSLARLRQEARALAREANPS